MRLALLATAITLAGFVGCDSGPQPARDPQPNPATHLVTWMTVNMDPYRLVITSPMRPRADDPATFEVDVRAADGTQVQDVEVSLEIVRGAAGSAEQRAVTQNTPMVICAECGSYRLDNVLGEPGAYVLRFVLVAGSASPQEWDVPVTVGE
jgi:hypothetical protein